MAAVSSIAGGFRRMPSCGRIRPRPGPRARRSCPGRGHRRGPLRRLGRRHGVRKHVPRRSEQRRLLLRLGRRQPPAVGRRGALGDAEVRARRTAELLDHLEVIGRSGIERHPGAVGDWGALGVRGQRFQGRVGRLARAAPARPVGARANVRRGPISRYTSTGLGRGLDLDIGGSGRRALASPKEAKTAGGSRQPTVSPPSPAVWMARQTFSGEQGISMWRTPRWLTASITAFCTAGIEPIVPDSPMPLAPNGFRGVGVSVLRVSKEGTRPHSASRIRPASM